MPMYQVERYLPGITGEQLTAAAQAAKDTAVAMRREGTQVRYHRSTFLPGEEKCFCLFDGPSADVVREVNERAGVPFEEIVEAAHITAEELA